MVIVGGYETFVSRMRLEGHPDQPEWLSHVNASVLKVKLATAIIGISSIHLLKTFINARRYDEKALICADRDPHHVPAVGARDRRGRPAHAAAAPQHRAAGRSRRADRRTAMTAIRQEDLIQSVADALQFISLLPPGRLHPARSARPTSASRVAGGEGRDRADPHQLADVRRRAIARSARTPASSSCS